ncbi:hypothetical protein AB1286_18770 [Trinickia sp. NRRL B-1857]|uniref:hypothetical protein n=1 Tax=Trinickia sp. NRRL B-1857 TaxID=3162879 RepID=UPI003D2AC809
MTFNLRSTSIGRALLLAGVAGALALGLAACGSKTLDYRNVAVSGGKIYAGDSDSPYSGKVTNVPAAVVFHDTDALRFILGKLSNRAVSVLAYRSSNVCDVTVKDGYRDGSVTCHNPDTGVKYFDLAFADGELNGDATIYSDTGSGKPVATATIANGKFDGTLKVFTAQDGTLLSKMDFKDGDNQSAEDFDATTGKTIRTYREDGLGQLEGKVLTYSPDGKLTGYAIYTGGRAGGDVYEFYPDSGAIKKCVDTSTFASVIWDESGKIVGGKGSDEKFDPQTNTFEYPIPQATIDTCISDAPAGTPGIDSLQKAVASNSELGGQGSGDANKTAAANDECVNDWSTAYQKERQAQGQDVTVSSDQIGEWQQWCEQGKKPN